MCWLPAKALACGFILALRWCFSGYSRHAPLINWYCAVFYEISAWESYSWDELHVTACWVLGLLKQVISSHRVWGRAQSHQFGSCRGGRKLGKKQWSEVFAHRSSDQLPVGEDTVTRYSRKVTWNVSPSLDGRVSGSHCGVTWVYRQEHFCPILLQAASIEVEICLKAVLWRKTAPQREVLLHCGYDTKGGGGASMAALSRWPGLESVLIDTFCVIEPLCLF